MAILGLTDKQAQFPCIGELRKGEPKPEEGGIGADLNEHFRFTTKDPSVAVDFATLYGDRPVSIPVLLPFKTKDENFSAWNEHWVAGGLKHRCDSKTCVLWYDDKTMKYSREPKPCPGGCKQVGRLQVIIPALKRFAYVTVLTTSLNDIIKLTENLLAFESLRGDLRGIPFLLYRKIFNVSTPQLHPKGHPQAGKPTGKRVRRDKWLLTIEPVEQWAQLQFEAQKQAATPLLQAGGEIVDGVTGEILGDAPDFEDDGPAEDYGDSVEGTENFPHDPMGFREAVNKKLNAKYETVSALTTFLKGKGYTKWPSADNDEAWNKLWDVVIEGDVPF